MKKIRNTTDLAGLPKPCLLQGALLQGVDFQDADLRGANLWKVDLEGANLQGADLQGAFLQDADLRGANLQGANLQGAKLQGADLDGANLQGAKLPDPLVKLPPVGESFIAWKKVRGNVVLKLEIPAESPRVSTLTGTKCRAKRVKVLEAFDRLRNSVQEVGFESLYDHTFVYRLGEVVEVKDFDDDIRIACTQGIHFFSTRGEAERY